MTKPIENKIKSKISLIIKMETIADEMGGSPRWIEDIKLIKESVITILKEEYHGLE